MEFQDTYKVCVAFVEVFDICIVHLRLQQVVVSSSQCGTINQEANSV